LPKTDTATSSQYHESVRGDDAFAARSHENRIDIELLKALAQIPREPGHGRECIGEHVDVERWPAANAFEKRAPSQLTQHLQRGFAIKRRDAMAQVSQDLREDPAEPDCDDLPEYRIVHRAHEDLGAVCNGARTTKVMGLAC
jgi:hypothetical protein